MKKWYVVALLSLIWLVILTSCNNRNNQASENNNKTNTQNTPKPKVSRNVRVVTAELGTLRTNRNTSVTIEPALESRVAANASGQVKNIIYREGSLVNKDDIIINIDDTNAQIAVSNASLALEKAQVDLRSAQNAVSESQAQAQAQTTVTQSNLNLSEKKYQEGLQLYQAGGISQTDLQGLEVQLNQARSNYQQANDGYNRSLRSSNESIALLRIGVQNAENSLTQAQKALADTRVKAPFAGEISEVFVEEGEFIGAGSPAFRIANLDERFATFSVPPSDAENLVKQGTIYIPYRGLDYAAIIVRNSQNTGDNRLVNITAKLYKSENMIPLGTVTQLPYSIELGEGLLLPSGAIQSEAGNNFVYVIEEDNAIAGNKAKIAQRKSVSIVAEAAGEVTVQGLEPNTEVIFPIPSDLRHGTQVNIIHQKKTSREETTSKTTHTNTTYTQANENSDKENNNE